MRLGFAQPLSKHVSFYPRLTLGFRETWYTRVATPGTLEYTDTSSTAILTLFAPFLFHVSPRFFVGAGPGLSRTFAGDTKDATQIYGRFLVGMTLGGPPSLTTSSPKSGSATTARGSSRPGTDYFVVRHLSVAGFLDFAQSSSSGTTRREFTGGPRVGYQVPLGQHVSVWPRADIAFGRSTTDNGPVPASLNVLDPITQNNHATIISLGLDVPVLFHVATHAFLGFGPYVRREILRHYDGVSGAGNANTSYGLSLLVGGWL